MQPKTYTNPKVLSLNIELELKAERDNAECRIDNVEVFFFLNFEIRTDLKQLVVLRNAI